MMVNLLNHAVFLYNHTKAAIGHARAIYNILKDALNTD